MCIVLFERVGVNIALHNLLFTPVILLYASRHVRQYYLSNIDVCIHVLIKIIFKIVLAISAKFLAVACVIVKYTKNLNTFSCKINLNLSN